MDTASGNQDVSQAHHSSPVVNRYLVLGFIISIAALAAILVFYLLTQNRQIGTQGQNAGVSVPTPTVPLKEEYSNPFSSTSQYQNPFENTSNSNPFNALE